MLWSLALLATLVVSSATVNWIYHGRVVDELEELEERRESNVMTSKWKSGGIERSLTSTRGEHDPGERFVDMLDRHETELAKAMEKYPEDVVTPPLAAGDGGN